MKTSKSRQSSDPRMNKAEMWEYWLASMKLTVVLLTQDQKWAVKFIDQETEKSLRQQSWRYVVNKIVWSMKLTIINLELKVLLQLWWQALISFFYFTQFKTEREILVHEIDYTPTFEAPVSGILVTATSLTSGSRLK